MKIDLIDIVGCKERDRGMRSERLNDFIVQMKICQGAIIIEVCLSERCCLRDP